MHKVTSQKYYIEDNILGSSSDLWIQLLTQQSIFDSVESFIVQVINKALGNFNYGDVAISRFSTRLIYEILKSLKEKTDRVFFSNLSSVNHLPQQLVHINTTILVQPKFYKLRTGLYHIIGFCFLDDFSDDYIRNIHTIFTQILENNCNEGEVYLMRVFSDVLGVLKAIKIPIIYQIFIKVAYQKIQDLLSQHGGKYLSDRYFIVSLLKFYRILCRYSMQYIERTSSGYLFSIIKDSMLLVSNLLDECNKALSNINEKEKLVEFVSEREDMIKNFFRIYKQIISNNSLNFSIFAFFGDGSFAIYLERNLEFFFLIEPVAEVSQHFY